MPKSYRMPELAQPKVQYIFEKETLVRLQLLKPSASKNMQIAEPAICYVVYS